MAYLRLDMRIIFLNNSRFILLKKKKREESLKCG